MGYDPRQRRADVAHERDIAIFDEHHETNDAEMAETIAATQWRTAPGWSALLGGATDE